MRFLLALLLLAGEARASPVVVELFTSQGCSSCPDADKVLSGWGMAEFRKGTVLPLSYNVDYWNYLGWRDLFSAPAHSRRQREYASALGVGVYTPQLVVAGRSAFVGSDGERARREASRYGGGAPSARLRVTAQGAKVTVTAEPLGAPEGSLHVMLALFENGLSTKIESGENAGRTLRADFVVRRLIDLGPLRPGFRRAAAEPLEAGWRKESLGAAAFLQDARTLAIADAVALFPLAP